jgi:hypothetical protein
VLFDFRLLQHYLPGTDMGAIAVRQLSILAPAEQLHDALR